MGLSAAFPLPIGQTSIVTVTVTDISNSTVQLTFTGLRFEWDNPTTWFIGGDSDKGAVLAAGELIRYHIPVAVPANITEGKHTLTTYVSYHWFKNGTWTGILSGFWVSSVQLVQPSTQTQSQPQTQTPTQTQTTTEHQGLLQQASGLAVIAGLILIIGIGLFLERDHIRRLIGKSRKTTIEQSTPAKTESKKPHVEEKDEQEV